MCNNLEILSSWNFMSVAKIENAYTEKNVVVFPIYIKLIW